MESDNAEEIKKETEKLQNLQNELSQKLYAQAGSGAGAGPGGSAAGGQKAKGKHAGNEEEDVIDAEFEEKDDEKK